MSVKQVKAFFAKVKEDPALAQKLKDAQYAYKGNTSDKVAEFAEIVIPVAAEAGFTFTVEDFKSAYYNNEGEASENELDAVAGGRFCNGHLELDDLLAFGGNKQQPCGGIHMRW